MIRAALLVLAIIAAFALNVHAECANACNGHGKCVAFDMCICNRNWQANDCSERVCLFGSAHVDTPKGDLDMSGTVNKPNFGSVADNSHQYPFGTTEQFPFMQDSDYRILTQTAHDYMECSNKGRCNREKGVCECFEGYDGAACQRASCPGYPNSCSGHGVCKTVSQLAESDGGNVYKLWNRDTTMGCECDAGYSGPDCSERRCKIGVDPLYLDDSATIKYSIFDFATLTTAPTADFDDGQTIQGDGFFAIRFFDVFGEDWITAPIKAGSTCDQVKDALYAIPNSVIPAGSLFCTVTSNGVVGTAHDAPAPDASTTQGAHTWNYNTDANPARNRGAGFKINYQMSIWDAYIYKNKTANTNQDPLSAVTDLGNNIFGPILWMPGSYPESTRITLSGYIYRIKFLGNPGHLREPEIITHLDGKRNSLMSTQFNGVSRIPVSNAVITKVWTDGQQGEDIDYFSDHCNGVTVTISTDDATGSVANSLTTPSPTTHFYLSPGVYGLPSAKMTALLMKCLGDSDATSTNNVEIYNWDYGSDDYPHLVKLVRSVTTSTDGGYYVALKYDGTNFIMLNPFVPPDALLTDTYDVYTTKGTLSRVSRRAQAHFGFGQKTIITTHTENTAWTGNVAHWDGDLSCEVGANNAFRVSPTEFTQQLATIQQDASPTGMSTLAPQSIDFNGDGVDVFINDVVTEWKYDYSVIPVERLATKFYKNCLNKSDIVTFLDPASVSRNPQHINLYTIKRLVKDKAIHSNVARFPVDAVSGNADAVGNSGMPGSAHGNDANKAAPMNYGTNVITLDMSTNWASSIISAGTDGTDVAPTPTYIYKFVPATASSYAYVSECSNRGLCDRKTGICSCFPGYTSDDCHVQESLAL